MLRLARENFHARDARVFFDEAAHEYTVDGNVVKGSVSSLWASKFEKFDASGTAKRCYSKWARMAREGEDDDAWSYTEKYIRLIEKGGEEAVREHCLKTARADVSRKGYGNLLKYFWKKGWGEEKCVRQVVELWSRLGLEASVRGTFVHRQAELHCNSEPYENGSENDTEIRQYEQFRKDRPDLIPYRTEWSVFAYLDAFVVAGQIDGVYTDKDGFFHMIDYKCCAHELTSHNPYGKYGARPFDRVPDNSFGHYACQQNIYAYILRHFYGVQLRSCHLLRVHSTISRYELVKVPDLQKEVGYLFQELRTKTVLRNLKLVSSKQKTSRTLRKVLTLIRLLFYWKKNTLIKMSDASYSDSEEKKVQAKLSKRKRQLFKEEEEEEEEERVSQKETEDSESEEKKFGASYAWWRPEFDVLANKLIAEGGFPVKAGNFWLQEGLSAINEGALSITSKVGGSLETADLIKETNSFYLQPQHDGQRVYAVFFGTAKERSDNTRFNDFKSSFKMRLDNVTQADVVAFQGLPKWKFDKNTESYSQYTGKEVYESVRDSTVYKILRESFCLQLASQVSKSKMHKDHIAKGEDKDGKFVDKYVRERLGKIDQDDPYSLENTDFTWLRDKTKLGLPLSKDEGTGEWKTFVNAESDGDKRSPTFEVELPIKPLSSVDFELRPPNRGPKVTKVDRDGKKSRATAEDIVRDFPLREAGGGNSSASTKMVMVFAQYDVLQNAKFAGPGLRCNVKEIAYVVSKIQESVDDACDRFNS